MLPNELLRYERKIRHNMTQEELAKKLVAKPDTKHDRMPLLKGRKHEVKVTARTIKRWEKGLTPIPYYQRELARVFEKDVRELGYPKKGIPFWKVPHHRNLFFTGREDVFLELHSAVELRNQQYKQDEKSSIEIDEYGITQPQALVGLGGIGKTQIAIEYAYRYSHDYQTVIWLNARSTEALELEFAAIPILLNLPEKEEANQAKRVGVMKEWLMHFTRWLLIFDNAEDVEVIRDFIPQKCFGHIIVTTQSPITGKLAQTIEVGKIPLGEATSFLLRRSKAIGPEILGTEVAEEKFSQARRIAGLFDGLPLALEQAGAYIEETSCGLAGYITSYEAQGAQLRQKPKLPEKEYPHTVATTWLLSIEKVRQANPIAGELLSLFAFLAPDAIPEELITEVALQLGPMLSTLANNSSALDDAMAVLRKYSLVKRHEATKTCSIHSLVQAVIQDEMDEEEQWVWKERAGIFSRKKALSLLELLRTVRLEEVAQYLHGAKESDYELDNEAYEEAKKEQERLEKRIEELEQLLVEAKQINFPNTEWVSLGSVVCVRNNDDREYCYTLVHAFEAKPSAGLISDESPLGKALLGHKVGDIVTVQTPYEVQGFTILEVG